MRVRACACVLCVGGLVRLDAELVRLEQQQLHAAERVCGDALEQRPVEWRPLLAPLPTPPPSALVSLALAAAAAAAAVCARRARLAPLRLGAAPASSASASASPAPSASAAPSSAAPLPPLLGEQPPLRLEFVRCEGLVARQLATQHLCGDNGAFRLVAKDAANARRPAPKP